MKTQDIIFQKGEGDNWFKRNRSALLILKARSKQDWPIRLIKKAKLKPKNVLEVGASNGWRLAAIHDLYKSKCLAIEPSIEAIQNGRRLYPKIAFRRGAMNALPVGIKEKFDLVIVHYVFHWIDRKNLFKSIAEIDRVLADGGHLIVTDFLPYKPAKVFYHHLPKEKVFTYKLDYAAIFLAANVYRLISRAIFDHRDHQLKKHIPSKDRVCCSLLQKSYEFIK